MKPTENFDKTEKGKKDISETNKKNDEIIPAKSEAVIVKTKNSRYELIQDLNTFI